MEQLRKLWKFLRPYRTQLIIGVVSIFVAAVLTALAPLIEGMVTTQLAKDVVDINQGVSGAHIQYDIILRIITILFIMYLTNTIIRYIMQSMITRAIQSSIFDMRVAIKEKMTRVPIRYFDKHPTGDLMSRMSTDVETLSGALQQSFVQVVMSVLSLIMAVIMMFTIDWQLALVGSSIIIGTWIIARIIINKSQAMFNTLQTVLGRMVGVVQEKFTGFNEIKLYNYQDEAIAEFEEANDILCQTSFTANFISGLMSPAVGFLTYIAIAISVFFGAVKVAEGVIVVGALQAFIRYIWQVNQPLSQMTQLAPGLQASIASLNRIFEFLEEEEEIKDRPDAVINDNYQGHVVFENIEFGYDKTPIIKGVSVEVNPGEMVAIVGPTGAGKTTIINLLMRFYDVDSGAIRIDGTDIRDMRRDDLRSLFGMVLQDTWLFSGKIKDNIAYGKPNASDGEIVNAAKRTNVHHFITTLPNGYDMELNEESSNISNGEKQLITIARALLSDPRILILDEATSSVDTRLDAMIQEAMANLMKGRTSFVIAHRLSTIRNADKILVMRDGNIIEIGNHDELMEANGFYADLYNSQFQEELE